MHVASVFRPKDRAVVSALFSLPGHDRYYNKYINVKKGGIGGVAMLLAGYVALSYLWEYDHLSKKQTLPHVLFRMFYIIQKSCCSAR